MSKKLKINAEVGEIVTVGNSGVQFCWNGYAWIRVKPTVEGIQFFTGEFPPDGTGTAAITKGSTWYNTENASTYVYMELADGIFGWVVNATPGPAGEKGESGNSIEKLTEDEIFSSTPEIGDLVYNTTVNQLVIYNGTEWKSVTQGDTVGESWTNIYAPGIYRRLYSGYSSDNPNYFNGKIEIATVLQETYIRENDYNGDYFSMDWVGYFRPSTSDDYTFYLNSDDGSMMWIGDSAINSYNVNNMLVDNRGIHPNIDKSGTIFLEKNVFYPIRVQFTEYNGGDSFYFSYETPTTERTQDLTGLIYHKIETKGL